jgi:hypothetical protein
MHHYNNDEYKLFFKNQIQTKMWSFKYEWILKPSNYFECEKLQKHATTSKRS